MIRQSIIKNNIPIVVSYGLNNQQPSDKFVTHYIKLKDYIQDQVHPCTYYKRSTVFTAAPQPSKPIYLPDRGCTINFINCGNGDACLIENQGRYALIDFGGKKNSVLEFLDKHMKGKTLDYAICTHFHGDHMADFEDVLNNYKVKNMIAVKDIKKFPLLSTQKELRKFDKYCNADNLIMIEIGKCIESHSHNFNLGNASFEFLGPIKDYQNLNDNSIVLKMNYQDVSVFLAGDISSAAERDIIKWCKFYNKDIRSKIVKVAHHGAKSSTSANFLKSVDGEAAVISCAQLNKYTHPDIETVERLNEYHYDTFVTYKDKSIDFHITPAGELRYGKSGIYLPFSNMDIENY